MELADRAEPRSNGGSSFPGRDSGASGHETPNPNSEARQEAADANAYEPRTLKNDLCRRGALPVADCLQLALSLTRALEHLHHHRLVHRDIKPSNIIFVNRVPKLADIGLVTSIDATRSFVGTDGYIPPEGPGTPQADLYSLGKVLYECVTGKDRLDFPELPVDCRTRTDFDQLLEFNEVLTKACDDEPGRRYQSATEMRSDLERHAAGVSIKRHRARHRALNRATKLAFAGFGLTIFFAIAYWLAVGRKGPPQFTWSESKEARIEYSEGFLSLHAGSGGFQAIEHFKAAIRKDPNWAEAYARLAFAWLSFSCPTNIANAREAAEKAVALKPTLGAGHAFLASVRAHEFNWADAEKHRALSLKYDPNSEEILLESALNLAVMGQKDQALATLEKAHRANADSSSNLRALYSAFIYTWTRQYDLALEMYDQFPKGDPWMDEQHAEAYLWKGDHANAMRFAKKAELGRTEDAKRVDAEFDALEKAYDEGEPERYWRLKLEFDKLETDDNHLMRMAYNYAQLGDGDHALEFLYQAKELTPRRFLIGINTNPSLDKLRRDPRFRKMIDELWAKK
jgi:tetratricopeptide (TPR) repeat protein